MSPSADAESIKKAFFARSKEIHPDLHPDDPAAVEGFQRLAAAYEVLSNPGSRREYDDSLRRRQDRGVRRRMTWDTMQQHQDQSGRPQYGVDPEFGRQVDVDMSPERMARAWEAYKERWKREEEYFRDLEERKKKFRQEFDKARTTNYSRMTDEDVQRLRENMRQVRDSPFNATNFSTSSPPPPPKQQQQQQPPTKKQREESTTSPISGDADAASAEKEQKVEEESDPSKDAPPGEAKSGATSFFSSMSWPREDQKTVKKKTQENDGGGGGSKERFWDPKESDPMFRNMKG